jgi:hypothetical protein
VSFQAIARAYRRPSGSGRRRGARSCRFVWAFALTLALLLSACGSNASGNSGAYGGSQNHVHDLLLPLGNPGVVLLATHIGLYRSADSGHTWTEVAGAPGRRWTG